MGCCVSHPNTIGDGSDDDNLSFPNPAVRDPPPQISEEGVQAVDPGNHHESDNVVLKLYPSIYTHHAYMHILLLTYITYIILLYLYKTIRVGRKLWLVSEKIYILKVRKKK